MPIVQLFWGREKKQIKILGANSHFKNHPVNKMNTQTAGIVDDSDVNDNQHTFRDNNRRQKKTYKVEHNWTCSSCGRHITARAGISVSTIYKRLIRMHKRVCTDNQPPPQ